MNSRERTLMALNHQEPDRIPLDLGAGKACKFSKGFYRKLLDYYGIREKIDICHKTNQQVFATDAVLEKLGVDIRAVRVHPISVGQTQARDWEDEKNFYMTDEWGTQYKMPKASPRYYDIVGMPLKGAEEEDDAGYLWPTPPKFDPVGRKQAADYRKAGYPVVFCEHFGNGLLQTGPRLYGFEDWLMQLVAEPERAEATISHVCDLKMQWWDNVFEAYGDSLDVICECDDLGTQNSQFVSMSTFRSLILPYHRKLYDHICSKSNAKIFLHACGSIAPLIPDLIDAGVQILNPVQVSAANMNPYMLKKEFGKDIVFWGGAIDTQKTLPNGTPQQVRDMILRNVDALAPGGGFIFTPVHAIQEDVPLENFFAMMDAYHEVCKY